jgi:carbon-monoxide dehydrogenase medium subunit
MIQDYIFPQSIEEAIAILHKNEGKAMVISGGTDLLIALDDEIIKAEILVDITRIKGLTDINFIDGDVIIGACATMADIAENEQINSAVCSLAQAAAAVGSPQIRNTATVGGNIVTAQASADVAVMLTALDAHMTVCGTYGTKTIPVQDAYAGIGQSAIDPRQEIVTKISFKAPQKNQGNGFVRLAQRKALVLPMLNVGVMLSLTGDKITSARIVTAPLSYKPLRATEAEDFLTGKIPVGTLFKEAGLLAIKNGEPRDCLSGGSKEYRLAVLPSLVTKALQKSLNEIEAKGGLR